MPEVRTRERVNRKVEQSRQTQERLIQVARSLFAERGFAATGTEELCERAGMTRGALYHQYADKKDLFRAVFETVEQDLGQKIAIAAATATDPWEQLRLGMRAFLATCVDPEVRRIVLTDGPSVLGWDEWRRIDGQYAFGMVRTVLDLNIQAGNLPKLSVEPFVHLIVGALNEAGLAIAAAADTDAAKQRFVATFDGVLEAFRTAATAPSAGHARR